MQKEQCYPVGFIMKPHGLKGEVTISIDPDSPEDFSAIDTLFVELNNTLVPYFIETVSVRQDKAFIKFEDIDHVEDAQKLKGLSLYLPKETRPELEDGDFYNDEVIGFEVEDRTLGRLGSVSDVILAGSNKLLSIAGVREILIPVNSPFIEVINKDERKMLVSLPDGYLDI